MRKLLISLICVWTFYSSPSFAHTWSPDSVAVAREILRSWVLSTAVSETYRKVFDENFVDAVYRDSSNPNAFFKLLLGKDSSKVEFHTKEGDYFLKSFLEELGMGKAGPQPQMRQEMYPIALSKLMQSIKELELEKGQEEKIDEKVVEDTFLAIAEFATQNADKIIPEASLEPVLQLLQAKRTEGEFLQGLQERLDQAKDYKPAPGTNLHRLKPATNFDNSLLQKILSVSTTLSAKYSKENLVYLFPFNEYFDWQDPKNSLVIKEGAPIKEKDSGSHPTLHARKTSTKKHDGKKEGATQQSTAKQAASTTSNPKSLKVSPISRKPDEHPPSSNSRFGQIALIVIVLLVVGYAAYKIKKSRDENAKEAENTD